MDDHEAYRVGGSFIELWKRQHFPYLQVEETYLESRQQRDSRELLGEKIGSTLGENR